MNPLAKRIVSRRLVAAAMFALLLPSALAGEASPPADAPGRFLFLVETSSAMRRRADGVAQTIAAMLMSDLGDRLREGDTVGLWTFNSDIQTGQFPLQQWSSATRYGVAASVLEFLKRQPYKRRANLDLALTKATPLVQTSPSITLLLVTDGNKNVRGTPFDDSINAMFRVNRKEQARVRLPFVVVLRAEGGRFVNGSVGLPPWRVSVPMTPGEIARANRPKPQPPRVEATVPKPEPPPLILKGPKPAEAPLAKAPETPVEQPKSEPTPPVKLPPVTEVKPLAAAASPPPASSPASDTTLPTTPSPAPAQPDGAGKDLEIAKPAPVELAKPKPEVEKPPVGEKSAEAAPAIESPKPAPQVQLEAKPVESKPAEVKPVETKPEEISTPQPAVVESQPVRSEQQPKLEPQSVAVAEPPGAKPSPLEPKPEPPKLAPPELNPERQFADPSDSRTPHRGTEPKAKPAPVTEPAKTASPAQEGLVAPQPFLSGGRLLAVGLLLLAVAGVLLWLLMRRPRAVTPSGSLISQSFERDKKEP